MKQHYCQSINNRNNGNCICYPAFIPLRPWTRCDGTCFQRNFYQQNPSYIYDQISHPIIQPWSPRPFTRNPSFNYAFYEPSHFEKIKTKHKTLDPSSYRVTVRRITPLNVATAAAEAYRTHTNRGSDRIYPELFDRTNVSFHQIFRTIPTTNIYGKDYLNSNNQSIPSVPSKKCVNINNGIQASSTSFITTIDDQKSFTSDHVSETSSEYHMIDTRTLHGSLFSMTKIEQPKRNHSNLSDDVINNQLEKHSSDSPLSSIDKAEKYEKHSIKEELSSFKFFHYNIPESTTNDPSSIDNSHFPILPSSLPPNIDNIKSNEILVHSSRSNKSIPSLNNERQKSSIATSKSSLPLLNTRSTLDFGLLIHETSNSNF